LEKINTLGLVYTIHGANQQLAPTLMLAHQDVVPVGDPAAWRYPPFDAYYDGEWLWGRGASDDKNSLTGILSAVEALLDQGWEPTRTLILAFGFDEECSGVKGARKLAEHLTDRYGDGSMAVILDEGGEGLTSLDDDVVYALPAVMEKGHVDIWLELHVRGGHSSIPFAHTGIGIVAEIIEALEANPFPAALLEKNPLYNRLICLAQYSPDAWPGLGDLLKDGDLRAVTDAIVSAGGGLQYLIQTSQAVDVIEGGQKINAMPEIITLGTNYRVAPQDSIHSVQKNYLNVIADIVHKYNLNVVAFEGDDGFDAYLAEAGSERLVQQSGNADYNGTLILSTSQVSQVTPTSPMSGSVWNAFAGAVQHTWAAEGRTVVPAGSIMNGNTDTRHYLSE
jgi:Gly-Xaa carboxypeptidase